MIDATELAAVVGGSVVQPGRSGGGDQTEAALISPESASVHSDLVTPGGVFFALTAERDGHRWIPEAVANGAAAVVVTRDDLEVVDSVAVIRVDSGVEALRLLAAWYRGQLTATVVAVVGSVGKTTAKDALVNILSDRAFCYGSPGSYNSRIGVALSLLACPLAAVYAVIELGASLPGELGQQLDLVDPAALLVTEVGDRYRENFPAGASFRDEVRTEIERLASEVVVVGADPQALAPDRVAASTFAAHRVAPDLFEVRATATLDSIDVETSAKWIADNVALAASMAALLGHPPSGRRYRPTSMDLQTWRSPSSVLVMRAAAVDEPMAWKATCRDAVKAAGPSGSVFYVLGSAADSVSAEAVATLTQVPSDRRRMVLAGDGPALDTISGLVRDGADPTLEVRRFDAPSELADLLPSLTSAGDVIVLFSGRSQMIEGAAKEVLSALAPSKLLIDVGAIESNIRALRRQVAPARIMAVVKAGAYGADAPELARHLADFGVNHFAVSHTDEGIALRRSGISQEVLVLLPTPDEIVKAAAARLSVCVHTPALAEAVVKAAGSGDGLDVAVHVEVNTGMNRTGLDPDRVVEIFELLDAPGVTITGLMSHLAAPGESAFDEFTRSQLARFDEVVDRLQSRSIPVPRRHVLSSAGVIRFADHAHEMVRPGLAVLGIYPSDECVDFPLSPALTLVSQLIAVHDIGPGDAVGYSLGFVADRPMKVGVVQLGYHDGIPRAFGPGGGTVVIRGVTCPLIGRVSMDSLAVDVTEVPGVAPGFDVLLFGRRDESSQPIERVADAIGTIPYEVIANLGNRIQRIFIKH